MAQPQKERNPYAVEIGNRMAQARKRLKMSQEKAAERTGISVPTLRAYEQGVNMPSAENLAYIAAAYTVPSDWLLGIAGWKRLTVVDGKPYLERHGGEGKMLVDDLHMHMNSREEALEDYIAKQKKLAKRLEDAALRNERAVARLNAASGDPEALAWYQQLVERDEKAVVDIEAFRARSPLFEEWAQLVAQEDEAARVAYVRDHIDEIMGRSSEHGLHE